MHPATYMAFEGDRCIASGSFRNVVGAAKAALDRRKDASILVFDGGTGRPIDIDFRGAIDDVVARRPELSEVPGAAEEAAASAPRGPGRPKLGVVAREVTLLPRHWQWLAQQPGGASVALRKLVDEARRGGEHKDRIREAREATYRFMSAISGNRPHFEDAICALFADQAAHFEQSIADWPTDVREHTARFAEKAFAREGSARAG